MAAPPSAKSQAAAPEADAAGAGGKKKSKKMLFIVIGVVIALIAGGAGAWFFLMKKPKDGEAAEAEVETHAKAPALVFVPLEAFTVNLADTDSERFAQIAVTLQVADDKTGEEVKKVMPLVRH
ncbi:MAG TPA: flagellar basal body-associated FliL family protein, partial [Burkholderiaceae bacterium]|nr:flagellar basal body-associated FliL family protein [Burkholderiaceae bacterium]